MSKQEKLLKEIDQELSKLSADIAKDIKNYEQEVNEHFAEELYEESLE